MFISGKKKKFVMENTTFESALMNALELPFAVEDVAEVEFNCGTTWITLNSGKVYALQIVECENENPEISGQPDG